MTAMVDVPTLPPVPGPPDDPTWLVLDGAVGWREATGAGVVAAPGGGLTLGRLPGTGRSLDEPSGSLGGLVPPLGIAVGPDGTTFLFDPTATLRAFDPCACAFVATAGIGGLGSGARQVAWASGIAIGPGRLAVCDPGNRRLSVFALPGFALLGHWRPTDAAGAGWEPVDVAISGDGTVYVANPAAGAIERFHRSGRWERRVGGLGAVRRIAVDQDGCLVVLVDGGVRVLAPDGREIATAADPAELAWRMPAMPFLVDPGGRLDLTAACPPAGLHPATCSCGGRQTTSAPSRRLFDRSGSPVSVPDAPPVPWRVTAGTWIAGPLDSGIARCQWHRVVLDGRFGRTDGSVTVSTITSDAELLLEDLLEEEERWATRVRTDRQDASWDCLVRSGPGRYLWLRLDFAGDGFGTPCIDRIRVELPRVSLRRYLPAAYGTEPVSADFTDRFLSLFDTTQRSVEGEIDRLPALFDPRSTPAGEDGGPDFLSWLAAWVGVSLDQVWPVERRREWLRAAVRLYPLRGTPEGMRRALRVFLGMNEEAACGRRECAPPRRCLCPVPERPAGSWQPPMLVLEHYRLRRWLFVGQGRLGDQAVLWGRRILNRSELDVNARTGDTRLISTPDPLHDPFGVYAHRFTVFLPRACATSEGRRRSLENLVAAERPGHTLARIEWVAPRFRIGRQSMLGYDAVIGRIEEGVALNETTLGGPTVLTGLDGSDDRRGFVVGKRARIGAPTRLG